MLNKLAASMVCDHTAEASPRLGILCGCGGTGIHSGLKIRQMSYQHFEGSTPSTRTIGEQMPPRIPEFHATLAKIATLHEAKNRDYATDKDPFSNFVFTETAMELFKNNADKTFVWPIATKLARLSVLMSKTGSPNFESIEDSFDDIATYVILWKCAYMRAHNPQYPDPQASEKQRIAYENQTNDPNRLGRLNYAGQSDEGKHPGQSHFHNPQRRTTTADERVRTAVDNDR